MSEPKSASKSEPLMAELICEYPMVNVVGIITDFDYEVKPSWWWLSFCDPKKPVGSQFLGVAIVPAIHFMEACQVAHGFGCNPGGEVQGFKLPIKPPKKFRNRLLSHADCEAFDKAIGGDGTVMVGDMNEMELP